MTKLTDETLSAWKTEAKISLGETAKDTPEYSHHAAIFELVTELQEYRNADEPFAYYRRGVNENGIAGAIEYISKRERDLQPLSLKGGQYKWTEIPLYTAPLPLTDASQAALDVLAERQRQITIEGWTPQHDDEHGDGDLTLAASCYAENFALFATWQDGESRDWSEAPQPDNWPWSPDWWKPTNPRRDLVKACALILAEMERLDRRYAQEASL